MINHLHLRNFRAHNSTQLPLGRLTVLVGDNASGKTSVLDALWLQANLDRGPLAVLRDHWLPDDLVRRGSDKPLTLESRGFDNGEAWDSQVELRLGSKQVGDVKKNWRLSVQAQLGDTKLALSTASQGGGNAGWEKLTSLVGTANMYRLRADNIAAAAYSGQPGAPLEGDGTNTAVALAAMKLGNDEAFQQVEDSMRSLIPSVKRVRIHHELVQRESGSVLGNKLYFDFVGASDVPAHNASQGTLIVLALLAVLHGTNRPNVILLDDFDHALHPRAQMDLVRMIKKLLDLEQFGDLQIVATTHSPYILDELEPADVHAFALRPDGTVASKRLSEHPDAAKTAGTLRAGQLWSLDRERDWVLG